MRKALLIGTEPPAALGYDYVNCAPYDAVVIGSLTLGQLLQFRNEAVLSALAEGKTVLLYGPGLPDAPKSRALSAALASSRRELKAYGIQFTDGSRKKLVTAQEARRMREQGRHPGADAVLTPLAREILEETS